jgi:hypothetical protein
LEPQDETGSALVCYNPARRYRCRT